MAYPRDMFRGANSIHNCVLALLRPARKALTALHPISLQPYTNFTQGREDGASNHNRGIT